MVSSMYSTLSGATLGGEKSFTQDLHEDMLYVEFSTKLTQTAGFGSVDQIYLQLNAQLAIFRRNSSYSSANCAVSLEKEMACDR